MGRALSYLKRKWGWLALALFLAVTVPAIWIYLDPREPEAPQQHRLEAEQPDYYPGGPECRPNRPSLPADPKALAKRQGCDEAAEEHRLKQNDLAQQTRSADAAEVVVRLAFLQTRALALATLLGLLTLIAAFLAAYFSREAAREAGKSVKDFRAQTAAHMLFNGADIVFTPSNNPTPDDPGSFRFEVQATNVGGTRGTITGAECTATIGDESWPLTSGGYVRTLSPEAGLTLYLSNSDMVVSTGDVIAGRFDGVPVQLGVTLRYTDIYGQSVVVEQKFTSPIHRPNREAEYRGPGEAPLHPIRGGMTPE